MSRVVEFESSPEMFYDAEGGGAKWHSKTAVDLTWVAGARPYSDLGTSITLAGSNHWFEIKIAYEKFMKLWVAARKGKK